MGLDEYRVYVLLFGCGAGITYPAVLPGDLISCCHGSSSPTHAQAFAVWNSLM